MARLDFALWDSMGYHEMQRGPTAQLYDEHIARAQLVEDLGFHSYFTIEHQNSDVGQITSPSVFLTAIARHTSVLRVGAMIWQLPFHNPMRLAQEIAMLDQLSHGRVEFGSGLGIHEHEFLRWGLNHAERAAISSEALKIIKLAWTQDEVTYKGKYWTFDEALPAPKPYQEPHPPIWVAAHSKASLEFAARNNYHISQNRDRDSVAAEKIAYFKKTWKECGHSGSMPRIFLQRAVHVAETDAKAREEAEPFIVREQAAVAGGVGGGGRSAVVGRIARTRIGWGQHTRGYGADSLRPDVVERGENFAQAAQDYDFATGEGLFVVGGPETVARKLEDDIRNIGYDLFCGDHQIGGMAPALVEKSIRLLGKEVLPAFR